MPRTALPAPFAPGRILALALTLALALAVLLVAPVAAQDRDWDAVEVRVEQVGDGVYVLFGSGGNIGLSVGEDGPFLVDDQFAPLTDKIRAAIATVTDGEVRFVVNTHWHGDHTGGNESFGEAGAMIVAHENVRRRMNPDEFAEVMGRTDQAPAAALPVVTFTDGVTFYWNDEKIRVQHVEEAHTDGDAVIWFTEADVVHMGDNFFVGSYPFIDVDSGGNVNGMIDAAVLVLADAEPDTRIIPGHGAVVGTEELRLFHDMLLTVRDRVQEAIDEGMSADEVVAAAPTAEYDAGMAEGFMTAERFVRLVYASLAS